MKRKSALATAAAITGTVLAAGAAAALNTAILDSSPDTGVGGVAPILAPAGDDTVATASTTLPTDRTLGSGSVVTLPTIRSTGEDPLVTSAGSSVAGGSSYDDDDDDHDDDDHDDEEHEDEEHEYEGHDDDD